MKTHLKVKICTLAEEIRIIKRQERKWPGTHPLRADLRSHRGGLSSEARSCNLAYGFLRGRDYAQLEQGCYFPPDWDRIEYHVQKFGDGFVKGKPIDVDRDVMQRFQGWLATAKSMSDYRVCLGRREALGPRGQQRRQAYKAKYWRADPTDQTKLKAELKAKWDAKA